MSELDACDRSFDLGAQNTLDHEVELLALFADVIGDDEAIERRAAEWRELFG